MNITLDTKLVGLLGKPLRQSFSQAMHNAAFEATGLDYFYLPTETEEDEVGAVLNGMRYMNYAGLNVTKPYKLTVMQYLDEIAESAQIAGAVNTIVVKDKKLIGYNTDGDGFLKSLVDEAGAKLEGCKLFMTGAGGAARAICIALAYHHPEKIYITGRRNVNSSKLAAEINEKICPCAIHVVSGDMEQMRAAVEDSDIVVNGSGLGMYPHLDETPMPKEWLRSDQIVGDLTYNPLKTKFLQEAEAIGCRTLNGMGMLVNQGVKAFELWTGVDAPVEVMKAVVYKKFAPEAL